MAAAATAFPIALPHCSDSCGKLEMFQFHIHMAQLKVVTSMMGIFSSIVILPTRASQKNDSQTVTPPTFTVSATKNKFVAVGCDTYAYLNGDLNGQAFSVGCLSKCENISSVVNGTCSGIGCCEVQIPEGIKNVNFKAYSFVNHTKVWDFNPCSYAFIIGADKFKFSSEYLISLQYNRTFPMVLDWAIGNETCEVAQKKVNYLCGVNTACFNLKNQSGYRCKCKDGYEGNPYLSCQDINECDAKELNNCTSYQYCVNELGSYHCPCMEGYHSYGEACVPDQSSLAIKLTVVSIVFSNHVT
uniref:EGF-like domain-containing protein n=1 Tax=Quercus lobata TaxID=97700 RepID=A0A7N2R9W0_QUELO